MAAVWPLTDGLAAAAAETGADAAGLALAEAAGLAAAGLEASAAGLEAATLAGGGALLAGAAVSPPQATSRMVPTRARLLRCASFMLPCDSLDRLLQTVAAPAERATLGQADRTEDRYSQRYQT